jgi:hypothetical protein
MAAHLLSTSAHNNFMHPLVQPDRVQDIIVLLQFTCSEGKVAHLAMGAMATGGDTLSLEAVLRLTRAQAAAVAEVRLLQDFIQELAGALAGA